MKIFKNACWAAALLFGAEALFAGGDSSSAKAAEACGSGPGSRVRVEADGERGFLRISGTVARSNPRAWNPGAHVDVQLVGGNGRILAEETRAVDSASPQRDASRSRDFSFSVRMPEVKGMESVRVKYRKAPHSECLGSP